MVLGGFSKVGSNSNARYVELLMFFSLRLNIELYESGVLGGNFLIFLLTT